MHCTELARKFAENFDASLILPDFNSTMRDVQYRQCLRSGCEKFDHPLLSKAFWRARVMNEETELGYMNFVENFLKGVEGRFLEEEVKYYIEKIDKAIFELTGFRNYRVEMKSEVDSVEKINAAAKTPEEGLLIDHSVNNPDHIAIIMNLKNGEKVFFNALYLLEGESILGSYQSVDDMVTQADQQICINP